MSDKSDYIGSYLPATDAEPLSYFEFTDDVLDACFLRAMQEDYPGSDYQKLAKDLSAERDKALSAFLQFAHLLVVTYLDKFKVE